MPKLLMPAKVKNRHISAVLPNLSLLLCLCLQGGFAGASTSQTAPDLCITAAQNAADQTGVPVSVLLAITLTETGRPTESGLRPWPWAINQAGEGHWFQTPEDAIQFAESQLDLGLRNFDVGCFQLNHRWHSKGFTSTTDMFDPTSNALYAAKFLADLYSEVGDWSLAAAKYHSRTPEYANRYQAKFDAILANMSGGTASPIDETLPAPRINRFPLLLAGSKGNSGSLVPFLSSGTRLIGQQP
jgi:hypothetical protein